MSSNGGALACPRCARTYPPEERFCEVCVMPLVHAGGATAEPERDELHGRARKVRPEYTRGDLVRVAGGRNQAEAELIQNLLIEEGVPSILRRSAGFDVPDFLAAGPRDVMVPESGAEAARLMLTDAELDPSQDAGGAPGRWEPAIVLTAILGGGGLAALIAWALLQAG